MEIIRIGFKKKQGINHSRIENRMNLEIFLEYLNSGKRVEAGSDIHLYMCELSNEAMLITNKLNNNYNTPDEIVDIFSKLTGKTVDESFRMFPPFFTDCGKNITIGKNVFINSGCQFQDQGGITIGDGALIGPKTVFATLKHGFEPEDRQSFYPAPISIGKNVWIGANVSVVPGVTIGDNASIGAGAVVTKNVAPNTVVAGVPAKVISTIKQNCIK